MRPILFSVSGGAGDARLTGRRAMQRAALLVTLALLGCGSRTALPVPIDGGCTEGEAPVAPLPAPGPGRAAFALRDAVGRERRARRPPRIRSARVCLDSNDGTKVTYVTSSQESDGGYSETLVVEDLASKSTTSVITWPESDTEYISYSSLAGDGQTVAYTLGLDVHVIGVDGQADQLVLPIAGEDAAVVYGHPLFVGSTATFLYGSTEAIGSVQSDGADMHADARPRGRGGIHVPQPAISARCRERRRGGGVPGRRLDLAPRLLLRLAAGAVRVGDGRSSRRWGCRRR